jgi:hypothetical protein
VRLAAVLLIAVARNNLERNNDWPKPGWHSYSGWNGDYGPMVVVLVDGTGLLLWLIAGVLPWLVEICFH